MKLTTTTDCNLITVTEDYITINTRDTDITLRVHS